MQTQINYEQQFLDVSVDDLMAAIEAGLELDEEAKEKMAAIDDENLRNYKTEGWKIEKLKQYIHSSEKFEKSFEVLKNFRIIKFKELIQNILYFQGKRKE